MFFLIRTSFCAIVIVFNVYFVLVVVSLVMSSGAIDCLDRLISKMTSYVTTTKV